MVRPPEILIDIEPAGDVPVKATYAFALVLGSAAAVFGVVFDPQHKVIWNRSASAPEGLYWFTDKPLLIGQWAVLSAGSAAAEWAENRGYVGADWPLLKKVAGLPGDTICREGVTIFINDQQAAEAHLVDTQGRDLPSWAGCRTLSAGEVFLLSPHPSSLDGRYFGPVPEADILGVAVPLIVSSVHRPPAE